MFRDVFDRSRLFQGVQLLRLSWFLKLFETVLGCYTLFLVLSCVLDRSGRLGSTTPVKLYSASLVRCVVQVVLVVLRCSRSVKVDGNCIT